jgi:cell division protein FtsQ
LSGGLRGKALWIGTLVFLALALAAGTLFWLSQSSLMSVDKVEVEGNIIVPADFIVETAGPYLRGHSLLGKIDQRAADALTEIPYVKSVDFDRRFPDTVGIEVREYQPVLSLTAGETVYLVAADATVMMSIAQPQPGMPLLTTKEACSVEAGERIECADANTGIQFVADIPPNFNYQFADVSVAEGRINATTTDGTKVIFGTLDQYELKFEVLRQLLARTATPEVTVSIDVSVPERPVTREGDTAPAANEEPEATAAAGEESPGVTENGDTGTAPASGEQGEGAAANER